MTCTNINHPIKAISVGEREDGTPFVEKRCAVCDVTWTVEREWNSAQLLGQR